MSQTADEIVFFTRLALASVDAGEKVAPINTNDWSMVVLSMYGQMCVSIACMDPSYAAEVFEALNGDSVRILPHVRDDGVMLTIYRISEHDAVIGFVEEAFEAIRRGSVFAWMADRWQMVVVGPAVIVSSDDAHFVGEMAAELSFRGYQVDVRIGKVCRITLRQAA